MDEVTAEETESLKREVQALRAALDACCERERRYRSVFDAMSEGFGLAEFMLDAQGRPYDFRLLEVNAAFSRLTGFPAEVARGRTARELVPSIEPYWFDALATVALTGEPVRVENYLEGLGKWFDAFVYRTAPGQFAFLFVDVTGRKAAERATAERFKLAEAVFTHSLSALAVLDCHYNFLRVNEAYARSARRPVDKFVGRNHFELYPSESKAIFDEVVRTKQPYTTFNRPFVYPDQPERGVTWWDWTLVPVLDARGEVEYLLLSLVEVTERVQAEQSLRESEARYRRQAAELEQIYRTAPIGLAVLDSELRFVHVNARLAETNGVPAEAHLGRAVREVVPWVADRAEPLLRRVLESGEPVPEFEASAETPAQPGVQRTWVSQYWPLKNGAGRVFGINVVAEEVTERRQLEAARERERQFRTLAENSTDVVARFDRALRRIYVNPAIEAVVGRPRNATLGRSNRELGLPEPLACTLDRHLEQVFTTGHPHTMEVALPTPQGERVFDSRLVPELGADGQVETVLAISRDITERKRAEAALRESASKYRTVVESLYEGIWLIDAEGITTFVNARMAELLGYRAEEMLGKSLFEFMGEAAMAMARANLARGYGGVKADYEFEFRRKDGTPLLTRIATTPLFDEAGRYRGALAAAVDLSAQKEAERALRTYAQGQDFLVETAMRLLQPLGRQALFEFVAERMHTLTDGGIVVLSEFDPVKRRTILSALGSTAEQRTKLRRLFGRDPVGITLDFPESIRERMLPGEFERLSGGICELAFHKFPQALCDALERELGIREVYAMAFSVEQDLLGTAAALTRAEGLPQKRLIESVVTQAALALKRGRAEEALRAERNFFDAVFDLQGAIVAILDRHWRIVRMNRAYYTITGFAHGNAIGQDFRALLAPTNAKTVARPLDALANHRPLDEFESPVRVGDGTTRDIAWRTTVLRNEEGEVDYIIATGIDITERKRMEARTRHLAEHDALTELPNRRLMLELLATALRSAARNRRKVALLFLDLDRFKAINDTLGHEAGDALLKEVAARLTGRVRRSDIVARLGGDEFTVFLPDLARGEQAGEVGAEIVQSFEHPFHLAEQSLYVTTSVGISLFPDDSDTPEGLLRRADLAMYEAKEQGRNTYRFYNPAVDSRARERMRIENALREALADGGLRVLYQPEVDLHTGRLLAVEALLRWSHPQLGWLAPSQFIPVAEETDLIMALDDWVLRTACAQARHWRDQGLPPLVVAVNLSAKRFERPDLLEAVRRNLAENRLSPESLELELTERTVMRHIDQSIERMRELSALGVRIAVDDFGTGYSSLNYLKRLPIDKLKIDQSFVRDIATDPDDRAIIQAVTALAHTLSKRVIAEGVETEAQRQFLDTTGCDEGQGFLFAEPLPPEQLRDWLVH